MMTRNVFFNLQLQGVESSVVVEGGKGTSPGIAGQGQITKVGDSSQESNAETFLRNIGGGHIPAVYIFDPKVAASVPAGTNTFVVTYPSPFTNGCCWPSTVTDAIAGMKFSAFFTRKRRSRSSRFSRFA